MDDKLKRECRAYVEKTFKKYEQYGSGSMLKGDVKNLLKVIIPEYELLTHDEELNELLAQYVKASKYTVHNKQTKKMEVKLLDNTVDFPSVLAITVHFLKKIELKDCNPFAGTNVVKVKDFPNSELCKNGTDQKKKLF